jgi:hypothetical protein
MPGFQKWMRWMEAAARFCPSGAPSFKNMSRKMRPAKNFMVKDGPQQAFEVRGQISEVRGKGCVDEGSRLEA